MRQPGVAIIAVLLGTGTAHAQVPAGIAEISLEAGRKVEVTDEQGEKLTGRFMSLAADRITVESRGETRHVPLAQIVRIEEVDHLRNGMLLGLTIGAAIFIVEAAAAQSDGFTLSTTGYVVIGSIYAGLGAGIGAGIDALVGGNRTIYRRNASTRLRVIPSVRPGRAGLGLVVSW